MKSPANGRMQTPVGTGTRRARGMLMERRGGVYLGNGRPRVERRRGAKSMGGGRAEGMVIGMKLCYMGAQNFHFY